MGGCVGKSGRNVWKKDAREGGQERGVENSVGRGDVEVGVGRGVWRWVWGEGVWRWVGERGEECMGTQNTLTASGVLL